MSSDSRQQLRRNSAQSADKFSTRTFADRVEKLYTFYRTLSSADLSADFLVDFLVDFPIIEQK